MEMLLWKCSYGKCNLTIIAFAIHNHCKCNLTIIANAKITIFWLDKPRGLVYYASIMLQIKDAGSLIKVLGDAGIPNAKSVYLSRKRKIAEETGLSGMKLFDAVKSYFNATVSEHDKKTFMANLEKVAPPDPEKLNKKVKNTAEAVLAKLAQKKCSLGVSVDWVMQHMDDPRPDTDEVPSLAAWSLRAWAMSSPTARSEFYRTFACKRLPTQRMIEIQERMKDDGHSIDARILEIISKHEAADDGVLSESPEGFEGESEVSSEAY